MHKNAWKLTFSKMQNQQLFNEKTSFPFQITLRFYAINEENFHLVLRATYTRHVLQKLMQKTSFRATDATTKPSDQEDNEKGRFFYLFIAK
jgi:hypothetical protein